MIICDKLNEAVQNGHLLRMAKSAQSTHSVMFNFSTPNTTLLPALGVSQAFSSNKPIASLFATQEHGSLTFEHLSQELLGPTPELRNSLCYLHLIMFTVDKLYGTPQSSTVCCNQTNTF